MTHAIPGARPSSAAGLSAQSLPTPLLPEFQQSLEDRTEVRIELGERAYPIYIGELDWAHCAQASSPKDAALALVVTNTVVAPLYLERLRAALQGVHRRVEVVVLPDGEAAKNWTSLQVLMAALAQHGGDRKTVLYALGGGVIGDLTGFAAAIWMRGVRFVQVPTTLLAQVDSSVGGKTGINLPEGKNLVGSFHQPVAVWADQTCLRTLPAREFAAGLAEVIKYGPIADAGFFEWIEAQAERLAAREPQAVQVAVRRSCEVKAAVVAADEREGGLRAILNFGHTFGHALEAGLGYGALLHGEAVAVGMAMAARLSQQTLGLPAQVVERLDAVLRRSGLPLRAPAMAPEQFLHLMRGDKKSEAGRIRYVLLSRLGAADLAWADDAAALAAVAACSD